MNERISHVGDDTVVAPLPHHQRPLYASDEDESDNDAAAAETAPLTRLEKGTRIEVYWTEMHEWYRGAVTTSRKEIGDDAQQQIATRVVYDPVGHWKSLAYWHCLDDEQWRHEQNE